MDLVDNYLNAVRPLLPGDQRDDIIEELDGVLRGRLEEKAAGLGRKLTRKEEEAVLAAYGHPFMVAGRYGPQHTLIGPELYPLWWLGARAAVGIDVIVHLARAVAIVMTAPEADGVGGRLMSLWGGFWSFGFLLIGALTVSLAVVERFKLQPFGSWKPSDGSSGIASLGDLADPKTYGVYPGGRRKAPSRVESGGAVLGSLLGVVFWAALPWIHEWGPWLFGKVIITPINAFEYAGVSLGPIWYPTLWAMILAGSIVQVGVHMVEFIFPADRRLASLMRAGSAGLGTATAVIALTSGPLFVFSGASGRALETALQLSHWLTLGILISAVCYAMTTLWHLYRAWRPRGPGPASPQSSGAVTG